MGPCVKMMPLGLVLLLVLLGSAAAQVTVTITTFGPQATDGSPNTFLGTGSQIASSLLESTVPAILWGVVSSSDVNAICTNIFETWSLRFSADIVASGFARDPTTDCESVLPQELAHLNFPPPAPINQPAAVLDFDLSLLHHELD